MLMTSSAMWWRATRASSCTCTQGAAEQNLWQGAGEYCCSAVGWYINWLAGQQGVTNISFAAVSGMPPVDMICWSFAVLLRVCMLFLSVLAPVCPLLCLLNLFQGLIATFAAATMLQAG
jgi:hypothetical protein